MSLLTGTNISSIAQLLTVLIIFIGVLALTYLVTRWMGGYQKSQLRGTNLEVIETVKIAPAKYVQIVRAGDKYLAVALGKDTVTMLTELDGDSVIRTDQKSAKPADFAGLFQKAREKGKSAANEHGDQR